MNVQLSNIIISVFLLTIVVISMSSFQYDIAQNYGLNTTNITYMEENNAVLNNTMTLKKTLENKQIDPLSFVMIGGWQALQIIFNVGDTLISITTDIIVAFGLPAYVALPLIGIILTVLVFAVLYAIFKVRM